MATGCLEGTGEEEGKGKLVRTDKEKTEKKSLRRATVIIYLDFSKRSEMVLHNILLPTLERDEFDGWTI